MRRKVCSTKILSLLIVGGMLIGLIAAARQLPSIRLQNKLETWLSRDDEQVRALRLKESYFPAEERVLVTWETSSLGDTRTNKFRDQLNQTPWISRVRTAADIVKEIREGTIDFIALNKNHLPMYFVPRK